MLHPRKDYQRIQDPAGLIPENEPVFLLRAQDQAAAQTVRFWAVLNKMFGGDEVLSAAAKDYADKMDAWPVHKLADVPAEPEAQTEQPAESEIDTVDLPADPENRCTLCGREFETPGILATHIRKKHLN